MFTLQSLCSMFLLFWIYSIKCEEKCEFSNLDYKAVVAGVEGQVKSSEPLHRDIINGEVTGPQPLKYSFLDAELVGMKDCEVMHVQCDINIKQESTFQYYIQCPRIVISTKYEADGVLGNFLIEGNGITEITAENYVIMFDGVYEKVVGKDQISRPVLGKYTMNTDPRGIVKYNTSNLFRKDKERDAQVNKFLNENWREMEKLLRVSTIDSFMKLFTENLNAYSKAQ